MIYFVHFKVKAKQAMFSSLILFLKAFAPHIPSQRDSDEAYLNESVDVNDLENRMRKLDQRNSGSFSFGVV